MSRKQIAIILAVSSALSLLAAPITVMVIRSFFGGVDPGSVLIGAALTTIFLGLSPLLSLLTWGTQDMKMVLLRSYVARVLGLVAFGMWVPPTAIDTTALAISVVVSAGVFLLSQSIGLGRKPNQSLEVSHN